MATVNKGNINSVNLRSAFEKVLRVLEQTPSIDKHRQVEKELTSE